MLVTPGGRSTWYQGCAWICSIVSLLLTSATSTLEIRSLHAVETGMLAGKR